jgi:CRP/FNR family transcriptional regulator, cyclic AMP receptor protein
VTRSPAAVVAAAAALEVAQSRPGRLGRDWTPVLEGVPLFRGLSRRDLRRVAALARTKRFAAGSPIVRAGDPGSAFYVILDGKARVTPPSGRPSILRAGDSFGEMALLDGAPRSASVTAAEDVLTMWIGRAGFSKLLRREPQLAHALLGTLAARLRAAERSH